MRSERLNRISKTVLSGLVLIALLAFSSSSAFASTAANTTISNTATVNYQDTAGTAQPPVSSTAVVTVTLLAATPNLSAPLDQTTDPATAAVYNYTITSAANGPDTYNLSATSLLESSGISGSTSSLNVPSIVLGASTVATAINIAANTATDIVVPSDGTSNASVNGVELNDTVIIGTQLFTVTGITDNASGTSTINVTGTTGVNTNAGDLINEQGTFDLTVTPGTVDGSTADPTITVVINAQDSGAVEGAAADQTITTVTVAELDIEKLVRNPLAGATWGATATGNPGDTLEYQVTVTSTGSDALSVVVTDAVPAYTTLSVSGTDFATVNDGANIAIISLVADADDPTIGSGDAGINAGDSINFYIGTGNDGTAGTGGTVAAGATYTIEYQVTIN